jgi:hypothetical protein
MKNYQGKTIAAVLMEIPDRVKQRAEDYLSDSKVRSVKYRRDGLDPNEFEAFIVEQEEVVLMPGIEVDETLKIKDIHCSCETSKEFCIHEVALLIAADLMIKTGSCDYHLAKQWIESVPITSILQ